MPSSWNTVPSPPRHSPATWKVYLGQACPHGLQICLVDGTHVRNHHDSDFSQGGNGYRYRFVPKSEIWIDVQVSSAEWPLIAFHECDEVERMKRGQSYGRAHDAAKRLEGRFRRAICREERS